MVGWLQRQNSPQNGQMISIQKYNIWWTKWGSPTKQWNMFKIKGKNKVAQNKNIHCSELQKTMVRKR